MRLRNVRSPDAEQVVRSIGEPSDTDLTGDITGQWSSVNREQVDQLSVGGGHEDPMPRWRSGLLTATALFTLLFIVGVLGFRPLIERTLTGDTEEALQRAGVSGVKVSYDGRDATLRLPNGSDSSLIRDASNVSGRRTADIIVDPLTPSAPKATSPKASSVSSVPQTLEIPASTSAPVTAGGDPIIPEEGSVNQDPIVDAELVPASLAELQSTIDELVGSQTIEFATGGALLTSKGLSVVNGLARLLSESSANVDITGYASDAPNTADNQGLSVLRAEAVKQALMQAGLSDERVRATGAGTGQNRIQVHVALR